MPRGFFRRILDRFKRPRKQGEPAAGNLPPEDERRRGAKRALTGQQLSVQYVEQANAWFADLTRDWQGQTNPQRADTIASLHTALVRNCTLTYNYNAFLQNVADFAVRVLTDRTFTKDESQISVARIFRRVMDTAGSRYARELFKVNIPGLIWLPLKAREFLASGEDPNIRKQLGLK